MLKAGSDFNFEWVDLSISYWPGPGTFLFVLSKTDEVFIPITYFGPSAIFDGTE